MTYEFFKQHVSPYLTDEAVEIIWASRPSSMDLEPENERTALSLALTAQLTAEMLPHRARQQEAA